MRIRSPTINPYHQTPTKKLFKEKEKTTMMNVKEMILENKNRLAVAGTAAVATVASAAPVFAAEGTADSNVVSAMTTLAADMVATGKAVIPVALTVVGIGLVVTFGIRIFRSIAG